MAEVGEVGGAMGCVRGECMALDVLGEAKVGVGGMRIVGREWGESGDWGRGRRGGDVCRRGRGGRRDGERGEREAGEERPGAARVGVRAMAVRGGVLCFFFGVFLSWVIARGNASKQVSKQVVKASSDQSALISEENLKSISVSEQSSGQVSESWFFAELVF